MKNLFLVTTNGERHEDHIPEYFCDFETLKTKFYIGKVTEADLVKNGWHEVQALSSNYKWNKEDRDLFFAGDIDILNVKYPDFYDCTCSINVILVQENTEIPGT